MSTPRIASRSQRGEGLRPEDLGLLRRIEAELALDAVAASMGLSSLPRRASGAVELVWTSPDGDSLVSDALAGRPGPLREALFPAGPAGLPAARVHHAAVLAEHALEAALAAPSAPGVSVQMALERLTLAWLELGREGAYLETLAARAGASLEPQVRSEVVRDLTTRGVSRASEIARAGLLDRSPEGHAAVLVLRAIPTWLERLALPEPLRLRAESAARSAIDSLVSSWLVRFRDAIDGLLARDWTPTEAAEIFSEAARTWEWIGHEPELERHALTALPELAWPIYRKRAMNDVGALLTPLMPLAWALERRVLDARAQARLDLDLPYIAPCAQVLVFWAEVPRDVDVALERIERAYALCPTLRNARIILAHVLCDRADHTLAKRELFPAHPPRADVERAQVFPELSRLPELERRVGIVR